MSLKDRLHEVIFEADTFAGALFDILLLVVIVASIVVVCLETVPGIGCPETGVVLEADQPQAAQSLIRWLAGVESSAPQPAGTKVTTTPGKYETQLSFLSWVFTIFFTIEYVLRLYCVRRPSRYAFSFWGIVDLLSFLPDYLLAAFSGNVSRGSFAVIRSLRLVRVFRIFKLGWFQIEAEDLSNAIWRARAKIIVFVTVVMILVTVMGTLMYEVEHALNREQTQFNSIPEGIYWAIVTMTTVGFGDIVPVTIVGKFLSAILILIGYSLIIVPTGFVSAEIINQKTKKLTTRSCPSCITEGHDIDAVYCKFCGERLD